MNTMWMRASKDYLGLLIGTLLMAAGHWLLLAHWAHVGGPEGAGNYSLALAVCAPIFMLGTLGLRVQMATDQRESLDVPPLFLIRLATTAAACAVACVILSTMGVGWVGLAVIGLKAVEAVADLAHGAMQRSSQIYRQGLSLTLKAVLGAASFFVTWRLTGSSLASMASTIAVWIIVFARHDARWLAWGPQPLAQLCKAYHLAVKNGLPLVLAASISGLAVSVPRFALDVIMGREHQGAFSSLISFVVLANMVVTVACQVALPQLSRLHVTGKKRIFITLSIIMFLAVFFAVIIGFLISLILSDILVPIAFGPKMDDYANQLPWIFLTASPWILAQTISYSAMATKRFNSQLIAAIAGLLSVALSITPLINSFGIIGASMALGVFGIAQSFFCVACLLNGKSSPR